MDRVKQDERGEDRRAPHRASARRPAQGAPDPEDSPRTGQYRPSKAPAQRVSEDRYRPGGRRTSAEPLSASWKPHKEAQETKKAEEPPKTTFAKLTGTYGWRVYALPILVVLTVLVVVNTANSPAEPIAEQGSGPSVESAGGDTSGGSIDGDDGQGIPENPATPVDLQVPTADLPNGSPFTQAGAGTWHTVPGNGPKVGNGKLYTYTVDVEDGIDPASYAGDDAFATAVQGTLSDPKSWTWDGKIALQRVDANFPNPTFKVSLTTPETTHRADACGFQITFEASCYRKSMGRVLINLARWVRGAKAFGADMTGYRQYAINHEVGHALGNQHVGCPGNGQAAPVMMQQSFGVADDYVSMLNDIPGGDKGKVAKDGRVCVPNSWPNPSPKS
ncbi:DUF3152 domain-containing protein [Amycolatopsis sp., V23-08]|uniref:DUF3152 domain-containing protein n=1 Tax=Amycolatopsis heterodermiae TaxID=3110235 RepID=A0ABU5RHH2_9PSEU|nr:DUF3152 domain-containing protein [Amycolatopsis sp., V23-08]MEA5365731.1 DUF3152 domain-containing protein [Amycolatopsis sp., V23-08]